MKKTFMVFIIFIFIPVIALAGTVNLTWDDPNNPTGSVTGYRIYYGPTSQASINDPVDLVSAAPYEQRIEASGPPVSVVLPAGMYYFRAVAYGMINGIEVDSPFSNELAVLVGLATINISFTITYP